MPEPAGYLLAALSGRALALAASRAGRRAYVLDLFGDSDMRSHVAASRVVPGGLAQGFEEAGLLAAAEEIAPAANPPRFGFVYGSGLEDRPDVLARLCHGRNLYGNTPETVRRTKDPRQFFELLGRLGVPHPDVRFAPPAEPSGWLVKRIGASGGSHVAPASEVSHADPDHYYQRRVAGRPVGVSFLADGRGARVIGFGEQWPWPGGDGNSYLFGGCLQPAAVDPAIAAEIPGLLDKLVAELGLVGLNSLDMLVDGRAVSVIEINPRPGANLDIFDQGGEQSLFALHLRACRGELPESCPPMSHATAMAVVYAERPSAVPADLHWPDWVADRPAPGAVIEAGAPVCTVFASAPDAAPVRALVDQRAAAVLEWLTALDAHNRSAADLAVGL